MARRAKPLRALAAPAGFTPGSLASSLEVNKSTVNNWWHESHWLDHISGPNLQKLIGLIPGVEKELAASALYRRKIQIVDRLDRLGIALDDESLDEAAEDGDIEPQYLFAALAAAGCLIEEKTDDAIECLGALWGRAQSRALDVVFGTHPVYSALKNPEQLMKAAESALEEIVNRPRYSPSRAVAQAHLAHQMGKGQGTLIEPESSQRRHRIKQTQYFLRRGSYMGVLRSSEDLEPAERYAHIVNHDLLAKDIEGWVFPSWCGDMDSNEPYTVGNSVMLRKTAVEVLHEIDCYNDVYVWYLVSTFLPIALELDTEFGGQLPKLHAALKERAERTNLKPLQESAISLASSLARQANLVL